MGEGCPVNKHQYWLGLHHTPGIGAATCKRLLETFETPANVFKADRAWLERCGLGQQSVDFICAPDWRQIDRDLAWLSEAGHYLVRLDDQDYPTLLREIPDAPLVLYACGQREILKSVHFAVVGSRNPSVDGKRLAQEFSAKLVNCGMSITSGLALGIDYCSHIGALDANGNTVAVLGNGLDMIYPVRHIKMAQRMMESSGLIISEFPPGTKPLPGNFPRRNRIISGMSVGVLVVEAALQSGSLITARHALDQGREVFAIPGSIHNPLARGCHALIQQGAKLVVDVHDILEELAPLVQALVIPEQNIRSGDIEQIKLDEDYKLLLDNIGYEPVTIDNIIDRTRLTADVVSSMLLILELKGIIEVKPGGMYTRIR
jgi:DNA processing protein